MLSVVLSSCASFSIYESDMGRISLVENISCLDEELAFETREAGFVEFGRVFCFDQIVCRQKETTLHFYA